MSKRSPIMASAGGGGEFEQPKVKPTAAVVGDVVDVGWQGGGEFAPRHQVLVAWELDQRDSKGKRFVLWTPYTLSVNEKATLRKVVDEIDGGAVPKDAPGDFQYDVTRLIGRTALVSLRVKDTARGEKVQIAGVMALPDGMPAPKSDPSLYATESRLVAWFHERAMPEAQARARIRELASQKAAKEAAESDTAPTSAPAGDDIPF